MGLCLRAVAGWQGHSRMKAWTPSAWCNSCQAVREDKGALTWCTRAPGDSLARGGTEKPRWAGQAPAHIRCPSLCIPGANWTGPLPGVLGASWAKMARGAEVTKGECLLEEEEPVKAKSQE